MNAFAVFPFKTKIVNSKWPGLLIVDPDRTFANDTLCSFSKTASGDTILFERASGRFNPPDAGERSLSRPDADVTAKVDATSNRTT